MIIKNFGNMYLGTTPLQKLYYGKDLIWEKKSNNALIFRTNTSKGVTLPDYMFLTMTNMDCKVTMEDTETGELVATYTYTGEKISQTNGSSIPWTITMTNEGTGTTTLVRISSDSNTSDNLKNIIREVILPDWVTSIGNSVFYYCESLKSITIPNSVTTIGGSAFESCTSLESIVIPDSVTTIGSYTFYGCTSLTSITIPNSVTTIGLSAFCGCRSLKSITIPNSVTTIGSHAFESCTLLEAITISDSVTSMGWYVFSSTAWYNNQPDGVVYVGKVVYDYKGNMPENTEIVLKEGTITTAEYAFDNCTSLTSITIPNSVTTIGSYTFYRCTSLTSITIPNSVTTIGSYAFDGCINADILCPSTATVGTKAFRNVKSVTYY